MASQYAVGESVLIPATVEEIDTDEGVIYIVRLPWGELKAMSGDELVRPEQPLSAAGRKLAKELARFAG